MKINKILVPVDFSSASENAFSYALGLAKTFGASLTVLHVFHIPSMMHAAASIDEKIKQEMQQEIQHKLKAFLRKHEDAANGVHCVAKEAYGYFIEEVKEQIAEEKYDLVVLGTEGAAGLKKILGSNAYALMDECSCPVLAIPPVASFKGINNIVFACDLFSEVKPAALNLLKTFSAGFGAKVTLVHVQENLTVGAAPQKKIIARLQAQLDGVDFSFEVLEGEEVDKSLRLYLDTRKADLLFMMPRHQNMLDRLINGSVTREMAFRAKLPILTLKEKK